jgi:hypothetical protein
VTTAEHGSPPGSRLFSWFVGCAFVGWLVAYNVLRVGGSSPAEAAWPSLTAGIVAGVVVFGGGMLVRRRLAASGRVLRAGPMSLPAPSEMDASQRDAVRLAWGPLGALALVALGVGGYLAAEWLSADPDTRAKTTIILAAWNLLAGLWLADEALRLRRGEADGIESIVLGCTLTAVLAGVGLSRNLAEPGQIALIALTAVAGALVGLAVWRLRGARGIPTGAIGVVVVAALSLILPLTL